MIGIWLIETLLSLDNSVSQDLYFLQMIIDLQRLGLHFVHIRLSRFAILADCRPESVVEVVLESVYSVGLLLLEGHPVSLNHPDQVHACLLLVTFTALDFIDLTLEGIEHLFNLPHGLLDREHFVVGSQHHGQTDLACALPRRLVEIGNLIERVFRARVDRLRLILN